MAETVTIGQAPTGLVPGIIASGIGESIAKLSPPKTFSEAASFMVSERIKKGDAAEKALRDKISSNWDILEQLSESLKEKAKDQVIKKGINDTIEILRRENGK